VADCTTAISINGDSAGAYNNRGFAYWGLGDRQKAIVDFTKCIALDSKDTAARCNLGNIYMQLNDTDKAIDWFSQAIKVNPNYASAYFGRAKAYEKAGDKQLAKKDREMAYALGFDTKSDTIIEHPPTNY
jgi:tetratricopeptide (TPR) repeat protein